MTKKIKNAISKLDTAIIDLECMMNESSKAFKKFVKTILTEASNNEVKVDDEQFAFGITYSGGWGDEYIQNNNSQLQRIYLKDKKIYVDTEDVDALEFDCLDILDKKTVAECLAEIIEIENNYAN